jgi:hypothetical protein
MTSNVADILKSAAAIGEGTLVSPKSHALQLAPLTAKYEPWSETSYYGFGVFITNGWIVQNPSFAGYAATMAYLPSRKLALVRLRNLWGRMRRRRAIFRRMSWRDRGIFGS